jgi:hypothetical protein
MNAVTFGQFITALDEAGFVMLCDAAGDAKARALHANWFPARPDAGQTITLGEPTMADLFGEPDPSMLPLSLDFPERGSWGVPALERACRPPEVAVFLDEHPEVKHV